MSFFVHIYFKSFHTVYFDCSLSPPPVPSQLPPLPLTRLYFLSLKSTTKIPTNKQTTITINNPIRQKKYQNNRESTEKYMDSCSCEPATLGPEPALECYFSSSQQDSNASRFLVRDEGCCVLFLFSVLEFHLI